MTQVSAFTSRFIGDVIRPWVAGQLSPNSRFKRDVPASRVRPLT